MEKVLAIMLEGRLHSAIQRGVAIFASEIQSFFSIIPGRTGVVLRRFVYRLLGARFGAGIKIQDGAVLNGLKSLELGDRVSFGRNCFVNAQGGEIKIGNDCCVNFNSCLDASPHGEIIVGDDVLIAQNVVIRSCSHEFSNRSELIRRQGHRKGRVVIENNVWIGANVIVTGNVTIGTGSVIGAGAVVTSDVPPNSICVSRWRKPEFLGNERYDTGQ